MAVMMADCEVEMRQRGQRGRCRHNNQFEVVADGWLATEVNGSDRRLWQQTAAVVAVVVAAALDAAVVAGGYGGDGRLGRIRKEQQHQPLRRSQPPKNMSSNDDAGSKQKRLHLDDDAANFVYTGQENVPDGVIPVRVHPSIKVIRARAFLGQIC